MVNKFKVITLDIVSVVLTIVAFIFQNVGFFAGAWWKNENEVGTSEYGMTELRICQIWCVDRSVLDIDGGREWIFAVRVFEVFGEIFVWLALVLAILTVTVRRRPIHTALIYIHGAAAVFIAVGVFIFLGFQSKLNEGLDGTGSVKYPFSLSLLGGITCMVTSVISGFGLKKHLLEWDDDDDDE
ncbi:uncharacterized protein LOC132713081 [Ruditapes philippinarum]|uniref:uncharacterized protein LOC132713081 n=1 Tax=Ruditapes philippinarum TaxID=129788 RepID=UPI00295B7450|nr:uncharacterized protein LOC132713081 [Ruditapes philippinarum]